MTLTGGIITLNEERSLEGAIQSLSFCDEILIVDAISNDRTCALAEKLGARVLKRAWTGFADQRNYLLSQARHEWVLMLDADERLPEGASAVIQNALRTAEPVAAFRFPRKTMYLGRWIAHGGWYPDYQTRLLNKHRATFVHNRVHETVQPQGPILTLDTFILHQPFHSIADQVETNNRYSTLLAENLSEKSVAFSVRNLLLKPWVKFFECYFIKKGYRDGLPGFIIAISAAYSVFMKWSKLWEKRESHS